MFFFFNLVIQVLYYLPIFRQYITQVCPPVKGVEMNIRKLFEEIDTSNSRRKWSDLEQIKYKIQKLFKSKKSLNP